MAAKQDFPGVLRQLPGRKTWVYQLYIPGKGLKVRSTGKTNFQAAIAAARKLHAELMLLSASPDESPMLSKAAVREAERLAGVVSRGQIDRVTDAVLHLIDFAGDLPLERITTRLLEKYQQAALKRKKMINRKVKDGPDKGKWERVPAANGATVSASTVNREVLFICRLLRNEGFTITQPKPLPVKEVHGRPFTPEELRRFFEACRAYPTEEPGRYLAFFCLLYCTGARPGELIPSDRKEDPPLLKKEVDYEAGTVTIRSIKRKQGQRRRAVTLAVPPEVLALIKARAERTPGPYVFPPMTVSDIFLKIADRAGLEQVDELGDRLMAHSFRHGFGTMLAEAGVNQAVIQNLLRHSDPKMTELYQQRAKKSVVINVGELLGGGSEKVEEGEEESEIGQA